MEEIKSIQKERGKAYGKFIHHAKCVDSIMSELKMINIEANDGILKWPTGFETAINYMVGKLARIAVTPNHEDSLIDLSSYADLWLDITRNTPKVDSNIIDTIKLAIPGTLKSMEEYDSMAHILITNGIKENPFYNDLRRLLGEEFHNVTKKDYIELVKKLNPESIIDIGCGYGSYSNSLIGICDDIYAVDKIEREDTNLVKTTKFESINFLKSNDLKKYNHVKLGLLNEVLHVMSEKEIVNLLTNLEIETLLIGENIDSMEENFKLGFRLENLSNGRLYSLDDIKRLLKISNYRFISNTIIGTRQFIQAKKILGVEKFKEMEK